MRVLALESALARCSVALVEDGLVVAEAVADGERGHAAMLPGLIQRVLASGGGRQVAAFDLVAVSVGPGGFTGIRAGLALAHGLASASGRTVVAVTVGEALAEAVIVPDGCALWVTIDSRRGHVFLERGDRLESWPLERLPQVPGPIVVAGDAAEAVHAALAGRGSVSRLAEIRLPGARDVAAAALRRFRGELPPRDAAPVYVDPPAVRSMAGSGRPAPS
jgi:tRNA threonylcarbamoyladenosine biosynthesis protein TsaB